MQSARRNNPVGSTQSPLDVGKRKLQDDCEDDLSAASIPVSTQREKRKRQDDCEDDLPATSIPVSTPMGRKRQRDSGDLKKRVLQKAALSRDRNTSCGAASTIKESEIEIVEIVGHTSHYVIFRANLIICIWFVLFIIYFLLYMWALTSVVWYSTSMTLILCSLMDALGEIHSSKMPDRPLYNWTSWPI
jgi:hypothetical protein